MKSKDDVRELTEADRHLLEYIRKLESNSLDKMESAAEHIITLVTSLLGLFLGILAFKDDPTYLVHWDVKLLAGLAMLAFLVALFFALSVVLPREHRVTDMNSMRIALSLIMVRKRDALRRASLSFGAAVSLVFFLTLDILLRF